MSLASPIADIEYPESDGRPMGETDLHRYWMNRLYDLLSRRYAQQAYVGCDLLVYFEEGNPLKYCVPDVFVALTARPGDRRTFKIWTEAGPPTVVFEVTSQSTRREDEVFKPQTYARMGVREYFLYDPTADYLSPPLAGYRLQGTGAGPMKPEPSGALESQELGLRLWLQNGQLIVADGASGKRLLTEAEAAEVRAIAAEEEVRRLRDELGKLKQPPQT